MDVMASAAWNEARNRHDLAWERAIPIRQMGSDAAARILAAFDPEMVVASCEPVHVGCRNSNYAVATNKGNVLLRMVGNDGLNNEAAAQDLVRHRIAVPQLLHHAVMDDARCFVYRFIDGVSLQQRILDDRQCAGVLLAQVAHAAAVIHNTPAKEVALLASYDVPPYQVWYEAFLGHPAVQAKMGESMLTRTRRLVADKNGYIDRIESRKSLIHNDFRPANMLVDMQDKVWFVDWEGAWWGHALADIGQFFRYRTFFEPAHFHLFACTYNEVADIPLPEDWLDLTLFRDLVNLLQLLSIDSSAPRRDSDLLDLVEGTLRHWGY